MESWGFMSDNNMDLYPDLNLEDIIKILEKKDIERLKNVVYSTDGVDVVCNYSYVNDGDSYHNFDIYYGNPKNENSPTVIMVHGGGLVYGTKELNKQVGIYLAKFGFNVININYRLLPFITLKEQFVDVCDAFSYIYENPYKLNLNADKIFLVSDSAGSFLTLAAFALMKDENFRRIFNLSAKNVDISAMAFISPMTGLVKSGSISLINEPARRNLSKEQIPFTDNILKALENTNLPPSIIITSEEDFIRDQALYLKAFLDSKNIRNKFLDFKKKESYPLGHGFAISHPNLDESDFVIDEIIDFFENI